MDPNAVLALIISIATETFGDVADRKARFTEACQHLMDWLRSGGFPPTVPASARWIPGRGTGFALLCPVIGVSEVWEFVQYDHKGDRLHAFVLPAEPRRICAWCKEPIGSATGSVADSHGICDQCRERFF